jgi:hypothetical protein
MVLDARLTNLAKGITAKEAARAHAKSLQVGVVLDDADRAKAEEFGAIIELMFLMAAVDGEIAPEELDLLSSSVEAIAGMEDGRAVDLTEHLRKVADRLDDEGWSARLDAATASLTTPESKHLAFRLAAGIAFVDDNVAHAEAAAIDALTAALSIDDDDAQAILRDVQTELFGD